VVELLDVRDELAEQPDRKIGALEVGAVGVRA
jgi:hypothetical protein